MRASSCRAHIWGAFFATFDVEDVTGFKVKAHASHVDVAAGRTPLWGKKGSDLADKYAKEGALERRAPQTTRLEFAVRGKLAREAATFAAKSQTAAATMHKELAQAELLEPGFRRRHDRDTVVLSEEAPEVPANANPLFACPS